MWRLPGFDTLYEQARRVAESSHGHFDVSTPPSSYSSSGSYQPRQQAFGCTAVTTSGKTYSKTFFLNGLKTTGY